MNNRGRGSSEGVYNTLTSGRGHHASFDYGDQNQVPHNTGYAGRSKPIRGSAPLSTIPTSVTSIKQKPQATSSQDVIEKLVDLMGKVNGKVDAITESLARLDMKINSLSSEVSNIRKDMATKEIQDIEDKDDSDEDNNKNQLSRIDDIFNKSTSMVKANTDEEADKL